MNESLEASLPPGPSEQDRLRQQVAELQGIVRLILLGLIITTSGLCLYMYRQTKLLRYQILAQRDMVTQAETAVAPALQMIPRFQQVGGLHPDYASNVLAHFGLSALFPTNAAPVPSLKTRETTRNQIPTVGSNPTAPK